MVAVAEASTFAVRESSVGEPLLNEASMIDLRLFQIFVRFERTNSIEKADLSCRGRLTTAGLLCFRHLSAKGSCS